MSEQEKKDAVWKRVQEFMAWHEREIDTMTTGEFDEAASIMANDLVYILEDT